jgi:hypothetical protein
VTLDNQRVPANVTSNALAYRYTADLATRLAAQRDLIRLSRWYRWLDYGYVVLPALLVGISLLIGRSLMAALLDNLGWIVGLPLVGFVLVPWINRWALKRRLRSNPLLCGEQSIEFTEEGIAFETEAGSSITRWAALIRVVETRRHFLFYIHSGGAYFLPHAVVGANEIEAIRTVIREHASCPVHFMTAG